MNEILTGIIEIVIGAAVLIVVRYIVPWIKAQIEASQYKWLYDIIIDAVQYAEQVTPGLKKGVEKKTLVSQLVADALDHKGISIPGEQVNAFIESAVFEMKKGAA